MYSNNKNDTLLNNHTLLHILIDGLHLMIDKFGMKLVILQYLNLIHFLRLKESLRGFLFFLTVLSLLNGLFLKTLFGTLGNHWICETTEICICSERNGRMSWFSQDLKFFHSIFLSKRYHMFCSQNPYYYNFKLEGRDYKDFWGLMSGLLKNWGFEEGFLYSKTFYEFFMILALRVLSGIFDGWRWIFLEFFVHGFLRSLSFEEFYGQVTNFLMEKLRNFRIFE